MLDAMYYAKNNPIRILRDAELALSPSMRREETDRLWRFTANPFEVGRQNQEAAWARLWDERGRRVIWC